MNKVSILLVDHTDASAATLESALSEAGINYTLYVAGNGKKGLSILMGDPYHELIAPDAVKLKPNLVILSTELRDVPAPEFLSIVGKYYSLRNRKFLLLYDSLTDAERASYDRAGLSAYLQRPLDKEQVLKQIKSLMSDRHTQFAMMPFMLRTKGGSSGVAKGKLISMGTGLKVATACLACALVVSTVSFHTSSYINEALTAGSAKMPEKSAGQDMTGRPQPAAESPAPRKQPIKKTISARPLTISARPLKEDAEPVPQKTKSALQKPDSLRIIAIEVPDSIPD